MFVIRCNYHHTVVKSFPRTKKIPKGFRTKSVVVEPPLFSKYAQVKLDHTSLKFHDIAPLLTTIDGDCQ